MEGKGVGLYIQKVKLAFAIFFLFSLTFLIYEFKLNQNGKLVGKYILSLDADSKTVREIFQLLGQRFITKEGLLTDWQGAGTEHGNFVLLETQGQLMECAVLAGNKNLFDTVLGNVRIHFLAPKGYLYWRLSLPDLAPDNATALVDQLRIIRSLDQASKLFNGPLYQLETRSVALSIYRFNRTADLFCDSYDGRIGKPELRISLFYIDPLGLGVVSKILPQAKPAVQNTLDILRHSPINELGFFPSWYDLLSSNYIWPETFMTVEQLFTIDFAQKAGMNVNTSLEFLRNSIQINNKIYNNYNIDGSPNGSDDSAAVYALATRVFRQAGDSENAQWCYDRMLSYRIKDHNELKGAFAYETSQSAFAYDQLEALLTLYQEGERTVGQ
ncbi:hypothetical protein [Desulfosporosinus sp.]|uniref:hypothetical protein n=1 Tax=Desulfosporosinus sp. TaxID=157907 RepID=UPI0025BFB5C4|nr:hypothetical protein [Desulfosporosinus sp.]MBC2726904.1 hypothetical protein [Desulfosporosinus sp.]